MSYSDPYQAYAEGNVYSGNPLRLVVALYEGAIECIRQAKQCLLEQDIWGRTKAINKAIRILAQLLVSLDHEKGEEISENLNRLYGYMQSKLLEAHAKQTLAPMEETERLLVTLLEGWLGAAEMVEQSQGESSKVAKRSPLETSDSKHLYSFSEERSEAAYGLCATF